MIRRVFDQSIDLLSGAWQAFVGVALVIGAVNALIGVGTARALEGVTDETVEVGEVLLSDALTATALAIAVLATTLILASVLVVMVSTVARGHRPNAAEAIALVLRRGRVVVGATLAATVLVFLGLLLFIVPGVWIAVALTPLLAVVVDGEDGIVESIRTTLGLVRGHWLSVFGLVAMVAVINFGLGVAGVVAGAVGFLLSIIANAISSMVIATVIWFTYAELRRHRDWPDVV